MAEPSVTPQTQPLIQASDIKYLGSIYAPSSLGVGQNGMAVYKNRWFFGTTYGIAELTLPSIGGTATVIKGPVGLPNIDQVHPHDRDVHTGGMLWFNNRLIATGFVYYDAGWGQKASHWAGLGVDSLNGPWPMKTPFTIPPQGRLRMVAGYMGYIPPEWRALLGGPALTGQCCVPIVGNSSHGPSCSVFNPDEVGSVNPIPSTMLIGYPEEHQTLGSYGNTVVNPFYGGTDQLGSVAFPAGTRSILFTGRHGETMCYGPGTPDRNLVGTPGPGAYKWCYDPYYFEQGAHGPDYHPTMWAYDANDVLAVKQGIKKYWEVIPYAAWKLPNYSPLAPNLMRAGFFDPDTNRYYVGQTDSLEVHVYEIAVAGSGGVAVDCVGTWSGWTREPGSESACVNNTRTYRERSFFTVTTPASNGGKVCPVSPQYRTLNEACSPPAVGLNVEALVSVSNDSSLPVGSKVKISKI